MKLQRLIWRHPEWWSIALSIGAWSVLLSMPRHYFSHRTTSAAIVLWLLMVIAMMFPLVVAQVRETAFRSLWTRRHRAVAWFLMGYAVPWIAFGGAIILFRERWTIDPRASAIVAVAIAVAWQFSPVKRRALQRCHRVMPLAPAGWRANWSCARFGWHIGAACIGACGALMTACALMDHSMWTMGIATIAAARDRITAA